jgi:glutamate-5-semialdehyde dehydrogenase
MAIAEENKLQSYCLDTAKRARHASTQLGLLPGDIKNAWLKTSGQMLCDRSEELLAANVCDLEAAPGFGLTEAQSDRLRLTPERIESIAEGMRQVAKLPEPIGEIIETTIRPNGLKIQKVRVPLGVVFFVYESRPNVTADAAALCLKSGNAVILRGGKEAAHSSRAIVEILIAAAKQTGVPEDAVQLVATSDREAVGYFLSMPEWIDLAIPRGGAGLIKRVAAEAQMPVIKHFSGNCHVYVDADANQEMAEAIVVNAKCQRMGVCNAAESLLVHADVADSFLPNICQRLSDEGVEIRGDEKTVSLFSGAHRATDEDYRAEYLGPVISVRVVPSLEDAIDHINRFGSGHTDAIVTDQGSAAEKFAAEVDTAAVIINASTRFNDGGEFGLGAEIGISTDKFHARGPCGLKELTSYKYIVYGEGQTRT